MLLPNVRHRKVSAKPTRNINDRKEEVTSKCIKSFFLVNLFTINLLCLYSMPKDEDKHKIAVFRPMKCHKVSSDEINNELCWTSFLIK